MTAWSKRILYVDLSRGASRVAKYDGSVARKLLGGRGLAVKLLWDLTPKHVNPLSPENPFIISIGPLTGLPFPGSCRVLVASKSPLTNGYGDGSLGGIIAWHMRLLNLDAIVLTGATKKPSILVISDKGVYLEDAENLWGKTIPDTLRALRVSYGSDAGCLVVGPAAEKGVLYSTIMGSEGRSGGRPGLGCVLASKKLKAIVVYSESPQEPRLPSEFKKLASEAYKQIANAPNYREWLRCGTLSTIEWANSNYVLPVMNFNEAYIDDISSLASRRLSSLEFRRAGCPYCNMPCGHWILDVEGYPVELDYENIAMLGPNLGIFRLEDAAMLNRLADTYGVDSISLGSVVAYLIEATEKKTIQGLNVSWGDVKAIRELVYDIINARGIGVHASKGVRYLSMLLGEYEDAMHVKGLEVSAYDCHAAPGMALAYATSPIGAHHKDAWIIAWEIRYNRFSYDEEKVRKVIELQRIRGGFFESLIVCRFPWVELGLDLRYYLNALKVLGLSLTLNDVFRIADRIYTAIRLYWIREYGFWSRKLDQPPLKWFKRPLTRGPLKGAKLDMDSFNRMLTTYYELRGWDENGVPRRDTISSLELQDFLSTS